MNDEKKERKWEIHYKKKGWRQIFDTRSSRVVKNKTKPEEFDNEGGKWNSFPFTTTTRRRRLLQHCFPPFIFIFSPLLFLKEKALTQKRKRKKEER
jgi:hypothetical protein